MILYIKCNFPGILLKPFLYQSRFTSYCSFLRHNMALIILRQSPPGADPASPPPVALSADPFAAIIAITVVMSVIVLAKAWAKVVVVKQFGLEDWSALIGSVSVTLCGQF